MKSAGKARSNGLYRHIRTSKEIIRNLLNDSLKSYIGRRYDNKLDPASACKYYFIFNIAFNILWDAPAPFREKFLFETGNQAGRHR